MLYATRQNIAVPLQNQTKPYETISDLTVALLNLATLHRYRAEPDRTVPDDTFALRNSIVPNRAVPLPYATRQNTAALYLCATKRHLTRPCHAIAVHRLTWECRSSPHLTGTQHDIMPPYHAAALRCPTKRHDTKALRHGTKHCYTLPRRAIAPHHTALLDHTEPIALLRSTSYFTLPYVISLHLTLAERCCATPNSTITKHHQTTPNRYETRHHDTKPRHSDT